MILPNMFKYSYNIWFYSGLILFIHFIPLDINQSTLHVDVHPGDQWSLCDHMIIFKAINNTGL